MTSAPVVKLTKDDPHYWEPVTPIVEWLSARLPRDAKVLEVGPGTTAFPGATHFVDFAADVPSVSKDRLTKCNIETERLPFADKSFEFCYCRHALEDMYNPFAACAEMSRVAKAGYVETPSPIAELCRGVDDGCGSYRGYHHHRFIVWEHGGALQFVSKYPLVEWLQADDDVLVNTLKSGPRHWNTYHLWFDHIELKHWQSPLDFDLPTEYPKIMRDAVAQSVAATNAFCDAIRQPAEASAA